MKKFVKENYPRIIIIIGLVMIAVALFAAKGNDSGKEEAAKKQEVAQPVKDEILLPVEIKPEEKEEEVSEVIQEPVVGSNAVETQAVEDDYVALSRHTYTVKDGDTLWDIAEELYGDGEMWTHIWDVNDDMLQADDARNADNPGDWIHAGQTLALPL